MAPAPKSSARSVFTSDVPFTETKWPQISPQQEQIILDLLCNLLEPLGVHRRIFVQPSKGRKRKRTVASDIPPAPSLYSHLTIGLNSTTRHLQSLAALTAPPTAPALTKHESKDTKCDKGGSEPQTEDGKAKPLAVVILPHPHPPTSLPHAHLPTLVHLASRPRRPSGKDEEPTGSEPTRLVVVPTSAEPKLASALHVPRLGALGIMEDAPGAETLVEYVRHNVGLVECQWIEDGMKAQWKGTYVSPHTAPRT